MTECHAPPALLGFRGRLFAYAGAAVGLALGAPRFGGSFVDFLATPCGGALLTGVLVGVGLSIEESGTLRRIRLGIALRLLGPVLLLATAGWAAGRGEGPGLVFALGAVFVGVGAVHDAALLRDLRHGQKTRLEAIEETGLRLSVGGAPVLLPLDALDGARLATIGEGRGVWFIVSRRDRIQGDVDRLPWASSDLTRDALVLTEHECNLDARAVVGQISRAVLAGPKGYR